MLFLGLLALAFGATGANAAVCGNLSWTGGEAIRWPCVTTKRAYEVGGMFVSKNVLATRIAVFRDKAFVAMPRFKTGVPITLGQMSLNCRRCEPNLEPFPSWSLQEEGNCQALQSVVDIYLDKRGVLWTLDTGIVDSLDEPVRRCPPKVLALNAKSGKVIKSIDLSLLTTNSSRLQNIVAEKHKSRELGEHELVYVSDAARRAILVYDASSSRGYRLVLPAAVSDGCSSRDVLYLGLVQPTDEPDNCLVFTYLSGRRIFSLDSHKLLKKGLLLGGKVNDLGTKEYKVVFLGTDPKSSRLFFRREGQSDVYSWQLKSCSETLDGDWKRVYRGREYELPTHVVPDNRRRRMRLLESSFPDFFQGSVGCGVNHIINTL